MSDYLKNEGFYWRPLGGNNIDQISGHCYQYTDVRKNQNAFSSTTIIVDLGKFDNHQALGVKNSAAAVPDIRELLNSRTNAPRAIFITHSHPDHLNGIVHYLKAGYDLPPLYGGKYTEMILNELYEEFHIPEKKRPPFHLIADGDVVKTGSLEIEAVAASHTCFDSLGFFIKSPDALVYHTGDMKLDGSTYFRKPTNLRRIKELAKDINYVVADFCGVTDDGFAVKEVDTFKKMVALIRKSRKKKIFIPVYPTHPEMYIIAFLAALKLKKNVIFYGTKDFYGYLQLIVNYGISFAKIAGRRIRVLYKPGDEMAELGGNFAVIGTYNDLGRYFGNESKDCFGIITAKTFFNPLKGQFNAPNIPFVSVDKIPELQGFGHGFFGDYEALGKLLPDAVFIPTHCPVYVTDNFRELARCIHMKLIEETPKNNEIFRLAKEFCTKISAAPATWLVVNYDEDYAYFTEVWQKPTSGEGFLKRTVSARRCRSKFKMFQHLRQHRENRCGFKGLGRGRDPNITKKEEL